MCCKWCSDERSEISNEILYYIWRDWRHLGLKYITDKDLINEDMMYYFDELGNEYKQNCKCEDKYGTDKWYDEFWKWCLQDMKEIYRNH